MTRLERIEQFIDEELAKRREACLPKRHPYIRQALAARTAVQSLKRDMVALRSAALAVAAWDAMEGYGANDDGYNRLAALKEAAEVRL
jgi:hypothetical protein